jgi:hypothetical protein
MVSRRLRSARGSNGDRLSVGRWCAAGAGTEEAILLMAALPYESLEPMPTIAVPMTLTTNVIAKSVIAAYISA